MKVVDVVYLECPLCPQDDVDNPPWRSSVVRVERDDGSLMTDFRRHIDVVHRPAPKKVIAQREIEE